MLFILGKARHKDGLLLFRIIKPCTCADVCSTNNNTAISTTTNDVVYEFICVCLCPLSTFHSSRTPHTYRHTHTHRHTWDSVCLCLCLSVVCSTYGVHILCMYIANWSARLLHPFNTYNTLVQSECTTWIVNDENLYRKFYCVVRSVDKE